MNQQPVQGEVSSIGKWCEGRELKSISSCKWLIQLKAIRPKVVSNLSGSKEVTQAMINFE